MEELKKWLPELLLDTIVAAVITLLSYIMGLDSSWPEAFTTFGTCFLVMFVLGLWNRMKNKKKNKER